MKVPIKYNKIVDQLLLTGHIEIRTKDLDKLMGTSLYFKRLAKRNGYKNIQELFKDMRKKTKSESNKYMIYQ